MKAMRGGMLGDGTGIMDWSEPKIAGVPWAWELA